MGQKFVPEIHDLGKLIIPNLPVPTTEEHGLKRHGAEAFSNLDWTTWKESRPTTDTWAAICHHHDIDYSVLPTIATPDLEQRKRVFLTILADHLAATTGRVLAEELKGPKPPEDTVYRLWNPDFAAFLKAKPVPITDDKALRKAIRLVKKDPDWAGYLAEYGANMRVCAEAKDAVRRVTSLLSHSELTGKFYRLLEGAVELLDNPPRLALKGVEGTEVTKVSEAEVCWVGCLVRATAKFHQQPVRPGDLGIFERLQHAHEALVAAYPDNLLFASADTVWLFLLGRDASRLSGVLKEYTEAGFYVECIVQQAALEDLTVRFEPKDFAREQSWLTKELAERRERLSHAQGRLAKAKERLALATTPEKRETQQRVIGEVQRAIQRLEPGIDELQVSLEWLPYRQSVFRLMDRAFYPKDISDTLAFDPPICEICQMRPGEPVEVGATTDYLCPLCQDIREGGFKQKELGKWLEGGRGQVLWLRIGLDAEQLERTVAGLFGDYVDGITTVKGKHLSEETRARMKANLRMPALLRDFVDDYQTLLRDMESFLRGLGDPKYFACLAADTWVLPVYKGRQINRVLREYWTLIKRYFPKLVPLEEVPIRLGMSIGSVKYPFYQHWRYVSNPPAAVSARLVGSASLEVVLEGLEALLAVDLHARDERDRRVGWEARQGRTYLHKLAAIEQRSGSTGLATAIFLSDLEHPRQSKVPRSLQRFKKPLHDRKLRMGDILAYYKLMSFGERR